MEHGTQISIRLFRPPMTADDDTKITSSANWLPRLAPKFPRESEPYLQLWTCDLPHFVLVFNKSHSRTKKMNEPPSSFISPNLQGLRSEDMTDQRGRTCPKAVSGLPLGSTRLPKGIVNMTNWLHQQEKSLAPWLQAVPPFCSMFHLQVSGIWAPDWSYP